MTAPSAGALATPRLAALARRPRASEAPATSVAGAAAAEACDLCTEPIGPRHGHLVDLRDRALRCVCRACAILFDRKEAGGERYRLVPQRVRRLSDFELRDVDWLALRVPVDLAFFLRSSGAGRTVAMYPGPMGATESTLALEHWDRLSERNTELRALEPDVEALLVDRRRGRCDGWVVPIDACYALVALFRTHWRGLSGGPQIWREVERFFEDLGRRAGTDTEPGG